MDIKSPIVRCRQFNILYQLKGITIPVNGSKVFNADQASS